MQHTPSRNFNCYIEPEDGLTVEKDEDGVVSFSYRYMGAFEGSVCLKAEDVDALVAFIRPTEETLPLCHDGETY